jgi:hypothetical protein
MFKKILALLLTFLSLALLCNARASAPSIVEGQAYIRALATEIRQADRIIITEHAFDYDAFDGKKMKTRLPLPLVYATRELTPEQRTAFARTVSGLSPAPPTFVAMCLPEPHHTVKFYRRGIESSTMKVCFGCGQSDWSATKLSPPLSLQTGLKEVVTSVGLHPTLDWKALARAYLESTTAQP